MGKKGPGAIVSDAGALIAFERADPRMRALLREVIREGTRPIVPAAVLGQVWRDGACQVLLRALLSGPTTEVPLPIGCLPKRPACSAVEATLPMWSTPPSCWSLARPGPWYSAQIGAPCITWIPLYRFNRSDRGARTRRPEIRESSRIPLPEERLPVGAAVAPRRGQDSRRTPGRRHARTRCAGGPRGVRPDRARRRFLKTEQFLRGGRDLSATPPA